MDHYEGIPLTTDNNANKDIQESANKDDGQERDNTNTNTKMFKHITAITCVIKPLVDCFLNNPSPVIYLDAFINRSAVTRASCCLPCLWMPIITFNPSPVTSVVKKLEWITRSLLLTVLMEAGLDEREYLVFNSDGSTAISMIWPSRLSWRNSTSPTTDMWYVLSISSDMLLRSWRMTRRWVQIKRNGWREECLQNWRRTIELACSSYWN